VNEAENTIHRDRRRRSRTINDIHHNKQIELKNGDDIDVEDFEFELFSDSDDRDYMDDDDEFYDDDEDGDYRENDDDYNDNDDELYGDDYDELYMDENVNTEHASFYNENVGNVFGTNQSSKRNSKGMHSSNNNVNSVSNYLLNEKKLNVEQRLVYNLLRRVLLPPK